MADNNNTGRSAMAAAAVMNRRTTESIIEGLERRYNTQRNIHTVGGTNDDRQARKEAYIQEQRHQKELEHNKQILELTEKKLQAEKDGQKELMEQYQKQIREVQVKGPGEIGFDTDAVSQNFSSTLEEIATNFSDMTRAEQKAQLKRLEELKTLIADSNATEKEFLVSQLDNINTLAQNEYNKRATMAARAMEKAAELSEQYMDISSLYAGFVDHNPVMMAMWRIGGDFIRRWRVQKKAQREAIARDKVNAQQAEELNERNMRLAEDEQRRADEINAARDDIIAREREAIAAKKAANEAEKATQETVQDKVETTPATEVAESTFVRDPDTPTNFNPMEGGDEPLDRDFFTDLFGGVDEDGDPTGFEMAPGDEGGIQIDDSEPVMVQQEPTEEQKAETKFIRDTESRKDQVDAENHAENLEHQQRMFEKLVDIEEAILDGNKLTKENGKALDKIDGGGGLLEMLGLGRVAALFKGPILKALMMFGPVVAGLSALLGKIGLGGLGGKLSGGYGRAVERMGGDPNRSRGRTTGRSRGGKFSRMARGAGGKLAGFARGAGGLAARGGGLLLRGGAALLGTTAGAVAASGAAGYGVGTLINDHVLSDDQKRSIGDTIGPAIDNVLSFFGNDEAKRRLEINAQMEKMNNQQTLGVQKPASATPKPNNGTTQKANIGTEPKDAVFEKSPTGNNLVIQTDKIEQNSMVNNRQAIEVPASKDAEVRLKMLETKVVELDEAKRTNGNKPVLPPIPKKTTQRVVKSGDTKTPVQRGASARNSDSSIQRLTDRFVGYGIS